MLAEGNCDRKRCLGAREVYFADTGARCAAGRLPKRVDVMVRKRAHYDRDALLRRRCILNYTMEAAGAGQEPLGIRCVQLSLVSLVGAAVGEVHCSKAASHATSY